MESMSPQQQQQQQQQQANSNQTRCASPTEQSRMCAQMDKRRSKALSCRRQSAPSLVISKALTRSRTISRDNCLSPVSPDTCLLVQSYLNSSRMFISHAYAQLKTGLQTQERHLFLFTDILLITKAKSSTNFKLKAQARVCEMWTANCMEEVCEGSTSLDKSFVMGWPTCNCVATFSSVEQKEKWLSLLKSRIKEEKEKDNPKTIPLKVHAKDFVNLAYKTIAVSNSDSANEVIRLALQQFGIVGSVKDFQLWVISKKDNTPYPLIGHEFPFSIQMSHVREPLDETTIKSEEVVPPEKRIELLFEQLQSDNQCQFILRPSRVSVGHSFGVDPDQKPFKRRRSIINWAFWRGSSSQLDDPPQSPRMDRLFGLPLSVVCADNSLPKPIMDMLVFLFQEGPFTRGIFRRSAGAKACRELRDKLDSGIQAVPISCQSIFVIAAVFKDFLRSIPGSLLQSDLYEKWMAILDLSEEEIDKQIKAIQRLVALLPHENLLLLKHVLAVLFSIQLRAQDNQMNPFNLAICIAPSLLSSAAPSSPETEGEGTKKVCDLARLMIENCMAIMGEDVTTLFDGFPQRCSTDGDVSDVSCYQMTDSSYDSLENELNDDSGSPFQPLQRPRGKPDSRSCDSVLTLSDCDLDQTDIEPDRNLNAYLLLPPTALSVKMSSAAKPLSPEPYSACEFPKGVRQTRRSSEPAIWNSTSSLSKYLEHQENRKSSYDPGSSDVNEIVTKSLATLRMDKQIGPCKKDHHDKNILRQQKQQYKPPPLHLDTSCTNLCSTPTSPTHSSLSSLDSVFSQHSVEFVKCPHAVGSFKASLRSSPRSPGVVSIPSPSVSVSSPRQSSPKEKFDWSQLKGSHGLHPNTWLKKQHRLSLSKDKCGHDDKHTGDIYPENSKTGNSKDRGSQDSASSGKESSSPFCSDEALYESQQSTSFSENEKQLTVKELRELHNQACSQHDVTPRERYTQRTSYNISEGDNSSLPKSIFYGQRSRLALCRRKPHNVPDQEKSRSSRSHQRRSSEPGETGLGLSKESVKWLEHIHRQAIRRQDRSEDPEEDQQEEAEDTSHFALSSAATKAVRDYFLQEEDEESHLKKSQEVALAIVHGKREWMRRCSDTQLEDLEKMFFAEESYV